MEYRHLLKEEITPALFASFQRRQEIDLCWRKENGTWTIVSAPRSIPDWGREQQEFVCWCLNEILSKGGMAAGAFEKGALKGIVAVAGEPMGSRGQYLNMPFLQVSRELRGRGLGKQLFEIAKAFAAEMGAEMLYISSQPSLETQAFYAAMGCRDASEPDPAYLEHDPLERQLECVL